MIPMFKGITARSVLMTIAFGKADATAQERRNYLRWGHVSPTAEHKLIVLGAAAMLVLALLALSLPERTGPAHAERGAMDIPAPRVIVIAPLA